jgi:NNP family nitrate/nitrite transporter-like MFS transporter
MFLLSKSDSYFIYALCSFGFGLCGTSFAVGIAYTSYWFPKNRQGFVLGIFGAGNAGAALTTVFAPSFLIKLTDNGANLDGWRSLPQFYAALLVFTAIFFMLMVKNKKPESSNKTLASMLSPLKNIRVWRFGLYYSLVFGMFVAFAQWLIPYFVNVYSLSLITAGFFAALFSFPAGVIRVLGGWMSDKWGARNVMYMVLGASVLLSLMMSIPKMDVVTPGKGIMAKASGTVTFVSDSLIVVGDKSYFVIAEDAGFNIENDEMEVLPSQASWQVPVVEVGQEVNKKELLAKGETFIKFQANVWIFAVMLILLGSLWGIGSAAVFKHIPDYFPDEVGVVGGMVGMLGGIGGFLGPIIFGSLLQTTGLWTTCWMFILLLSIACLVWMYRVIQKMLSKEVSEKLMQKMDN